MPRLLLLDAPTVKFLLTRPRTPLKLLRFLLEEAASGRISAEAARAPIAWAIVAAQTTTSGESLVACATDPIYATDAGFVSWCDIRLRGTRSPPGTHRAWCRRLRHVHQRTARRRTQRRASKQ